MRELRAARRGGRPRLLRLPSGGSGPGHSNLPRPTPARSLVRSAPPRPSRARSCASLVACLRKMHVGCRATYFSVVEVAMRADVIPGAVFPDYELPDQTGK